MATPKKYIRDHVVLLLLSINAFVALFSIFWILLKLSGSRSGGGYIVQYRQHIGISAFKTGDVSGLLSFIGFVITIAIFELVLSMRTYPLRRQLALAILALGILLQILAFIVSNALLVLR
jgi:hypothetical protein